MPTNPPKEHELSLPPESAESSVEPLPTPAILPLEPLPSPHDVIGPVSPPAALAAPELPGWGLISALLALLALLFGSFFWGLVLGQYYYQDCWIMTKPGFDLTAPSVKIVVAATALNNLLLLIVLALYLKLRMGRIFYPLALRSTPWRGGLLFFLVTPCFAIAIEMLYSFCLQAWGVQPESQNIAALFLTTESVLFRSLMILFGVLLAPLAEEVVFRGILYPVLKQRCRTSVSIGLNGLVFGLAHFSDPQSILPVCFLGGFLAYSFERTKSLWVPILAHISNNLVAFGLLLISELIMNVTAH